MPDRRRRIGNIEDFLFTDRKKKREGFANAKRLALLHATAVAAIVLAGKPKINEPLSEAWARVLQHYGIKNEGEQYADRLAAARPDGSWATAPTSSMKGPRRSSRASSRRMPKRQSVTGSEPDVQNQEP